MTISVTVRKLHLGVALIVVAVLAPASAALAAHVFVDVPDSKFYAEPVQWALDNDITTGSPAGADTFRPEDAVTRGEVVTFLKRYHDNLALPAITANTTASADNAADIAELRTATPFAATASEPLGAGVTNTPMAYVTVSVTAPADGHVTVNSTARVTHTGADGSEVFCAITESTAIPGFFSGTEESFQIFEKNGAADSGSVSGTRTFEITAESTVDYVLACEEGGDGGQFNGGNLTAIFTPAP